MFLLLCNQKVKELETTGEIKNKLLKDIIRKEQADWSIEDFVKAGEEYALSEHRRRLQIEIEHLKRGKESVESLGELFRRLARAS